MNRSWGGGRWGNNRWEQRDPWQNREEESRYGWLKRFVASVLIFGVVYVAEASETTVGHKVTEGVRYILTAETDFAYLADKLSGLSNRNFDVSVLKRMQSTMLRPADPLLYMTKPADGKVVASFGWYTDPNTKQSTLNEGIAIEVPVGSAVKAAAAGKVKMVSESAQYGKVLTVEHSTEIDTVYGYLGEVLVKPEDVVSQGQIIARSGKSAKSSVNAVYFEVREKGKAIDPLSRIKAESR